VKPLVALVAIAALLAVDTSGSAATGAASCQVTRPNGRPMPGLFGNGRLSAPTYFPRITVAPRMLQPDGWIGEKFPWRGHGVTGDLRVTGRRLDRPGRPVRTIVNRGAPLGESVEAFWAVAILFPTTGCWRITGTAGTARLSFVTRVVDPRGYTRRRR